jgi:hypothetical protein
MVRYLALFGLGLSLIAGVAAGQDAADEYLVFFLNGKSFCAMGELQVVGKSAHITRVDGNLVSYPVHLLDLVETERNRQLNFGCARVIEVGGRAQARMATPTPTPAMGTRPLLVPGADTEPAEVDSSEPTPVPDITLRTEPYSDAKVVVAFEQLLDERHVYLRETSVGSRPEYLFFRVTTDSQGEVFSTLTTVAEGYTMVNEVMTAGAPAAVELEMIRTSGLEAGRFRILPDMAKTLANGQITVEEFFFRNVKF